MNVLLTNKCNRQCPYCFAGERISFKLKGDELPRSAPSYISDEDFEKVLLFAHSSRQQRISLLGGEPSLHPEFDKILQRAWDEKLNVTVFSNGMWPEEMIAFVENAEIGDNRKLSIVVNVNQPEDTPEHERTAQIRLLSRLGRLCSISFNIYREDFDPSFLATTILENKCIKHIRLGMAVPLARQENSHVAITRYDKISPTIIRLAKQCDEHNITVGFDCGFLLCMFTPEELGTLQLLGAPFTSRCGPAIDIGTDLSVWCCFPLSTFSNGSNLDDFVNEEQLVTHFNRQLGRLFKAGAMEKCAGCKFRRRGQCCGGCAAHVYRSLIPPVRVHHEK